MKTDKIRKFLLPNIPYLFIGWAILKISTAYRMAAGADFLTKAMGIGQTIGPAFTDLAPGLHPVDWLVGIVMWSRPLRPSSVWKNGLTIWKKQKSALPIRNHRKSPAP